MIRQSGSARNSSQAGALSSMSTTESTGSCCSVNTSPHFTGKLQLHAAGTCASIPLPLNCSGIVSSWHQQLLDDIEAVNMEPLSTSESTDRRHSSASTMTIDARECEFKTAAASCELRSERPEAADVDVANISPSKS